MTNAPRRITVYLCIILAIIGLILWLLPVIGFGFGMGYLLNIAGFVLLFIAWLLLTIACFMKGL